MFGGLKIGGAWDWSMIRCEDVVVLGDTMNCPTIPTATGAREMETEVGWPTSACVVGMVLQQSSP